MGIGKRNLKHKETIGQTSCMSKATLANPRGNGRADVSAICLRGGRMFSVLTKSGPELDHSCCSEDAEIEPISDSTVSAMVGV